MNKIKHIILDRDGVINYDSYDYIKSLEEFVPIKSSISAIAKAKQAGIKVYIASNQSAIGRGMITLNMAKDIFKKLNDIVLEENGEITDIAFCPHKPEDKCECRKPKPGLLLNLMQKHGFNVDESVFIGDSLRDLEAATSIKMPAMLVQTGNGKVTKEKNGNYILAHRIKVFDDLSQAVSEIIGTN